METNIRKRMGHAHKLILRVYAKGIESSREELIRLRKKTKNEFFEKWIDKRLQEIKR